MIGVLLAGCGSSNPNTSTTHPVTGLTKRVLLSNQQTGQVNIINAQKDLPTSSNVTANGATKMVTAGGSTGFTAIMQSTNPGQVSIYNNSTEQITQAPLVADTPVDIAISPDGKTAWVAERNAGFVQAIDTASGNISATVPVQSASRIVLSPNGTKLLAFSDDPINTVFLIDTQTVLTTGNKTATAITDPSFDHPFNAVFNGAETNAFILNCGPECGGTAANISHLDFSAAPAVTATVSGCSTTVTTNCVFGGTEALLQGSNLFVAGTPPTLPAGVVCPVRACGTLQVINTGSLSAGNPIAITDGRHLLMSLTSNSRLYIGASNCTPTPVAGQNLVFGCLSIFDTAANAVTIPQENSLRPNFNVTAFQPISNRTVIYVVQGFELDIFDITTNAPSTTITPIDVLGKAVGIVQIDP